MAFDTGAALYLRSPRHGGSGADSYKSTYSLCDRNSALDTSCLLCDDAHNSPCKEGVIRAKAWQDEEVGWIVKPRTRLPLGLAEPKP